MTKLRTKARADSIKKDIEKRIKDLKSILSKVDTTEDTDMMINLKTVHKDIINLIIDIHIWRKK